MNSHPHTSRCTCSICRPDKYRTPIIDTVRRQHAEDDAKGYNPYNRPAPRPVDPVAPLTAPATRAVAGALLATYNSTLTIKE